MKKILILLFLLSIWLPIPLMAISMRVGDTQTLSIGSVSHLQGCQWTISRPNDVVFVTTPQAYSTQVTIKAVNAFPSTSPCVVQCKYYYLELDPTTGRYIYSRSRFKDWTIFVDEIKPTGVSLSPSSITMDVGESRPISASITPSNATATNLSWQNNKSSVVTFTKTRNDKITVYGKASGNATITVTTSNGYSATCSVTVRSKDPTGVTLSQSSITLTEGATTTLTATILPSGATTTLTWSSDDKGVATVSSSGLVKAIGSGKTIVRVKTSNGYSDYCNVKVTPLPTSVSLPSTLSMTIGTTKTLTPALTPSDATTSYTWSSDNTNVATVSSSGIVKGIAVGEANIIVKTSNGKTATCKVTVKEPVDPTAVRLNVNAVQITKGYYVYLIPTLEPSDASTTYIWASSDASIATVTNAGTVYGNNEGEATITVKTKNEKTNTCIVKIVAPTTQTEDSKVFPKVKALKSLINKTLRQLTD